MSISTPLPYRADIDGLRAVAVLAVFFFHAGVGLDGGYLGVDVFFVISGYLITLMLSSSGATRMSTIGEFWVRRWFRIAPALVAVCAVSSVASWFLMTPIEMKAYGASLPATFGYYSNFLLAGQAGYFDAPSLSKPLLHTWSLSLELQFYLLFPLIMCLVGGRSWLQRLVLLGALLASFLISCVLIRSQPVQAYFLPHARIWEFLAGGLLAQLPKPTRLHRGLLWCVEVGGALVLGLCFLRYSANSRFPGEMALPPVLATAALLWSGDASCGGPVSRCLTSRPMVAMGRISYSFYLWHWPLIVFCTYAIAERPRGFVIVALLIASLALAAITRRWIELPFLRYRKKSTLSWGGRIVFLSATTGLLAWCGFLADRSEGWPGRWSSVAAAYAAGATDVAPRAEQCHTLKPERVLSRDLCSLGDPGDEPPGFLVWGDSHAHALYGVFDQLARNHGLRGLHASYSACPPLLGVEVATHINDECRRFNTAMIEFIEQARIPVIVLVAYWSIYPLGHLPGGLDMGKAPFLVHDVGQIGSAQESQVLFASGLNETIRRLTAKGTKIYLVEQVPEVSASVPSSLARAELFPWKPEHYLQPQRAEVEQRQAFVRTQFQMLAHKYQFELISPLDMMCVQSYCEIESVGRPLYRDSNHLSAFGAAQMAPLLSTIFNQAPLGSGIAR